MVIASTIGTQTPPLQATFNEQDMAEMGLRDITNHLDDADKRIIHLSVATQEGLRKRTLQLAAKDAAMIACYRNVINHLEASRITTNDLIARQINVIEIQKNKINEGKKENSSLQNRILQLETDNFLSVVLRIFGLTTGLIAGLLVVDEPSLSLETAKTVGACAFAGEIFTHVGGYMTKKIIIHFDPNSSLRGAFRP